MDKGAGDAQGRAMPYIVNSSPGAGLRFEPSSTLADKSAAMKWAVGLEERGMRQIRIKDTVSGLVYDVASLRAAIKAE
ncbi:hypothetical protein U91I_00751 [alpha proteobacterium U9-1i]|nr:hypothetical protein U91I_00751 [alpha proteobacterium U9-1i]